MAHVVEVSIVYTVGICFTRMDLTPVPQYTPGSGPPSSPAPEFPYFGQGAHGRQIATLSPSCYLEAWK